MLLASSIIKISSSMLEPDYEEPWRTPARSRENTGSGFVVAPGFILTNAHVVANSTFINVRLAYGSQQYRAKVHTIDHHCDLALLKVTDTSFTKQAKVAILGEMVALLDGVQVIGFPMGGEELSVTTGIVSRIEVTCYEHAGINLLTAQVDAAINAGNSGGPVFSGSNVVGIAFQGFDEGQNLGYMIPIPVIKHFLTEALQGNKYVYRGFPDVGIVTQEMLNIQIRNYFGLTQDQTGVRVCKVNPLSSAFNVLQENDVILKIDGVDVNNDGTMCFAGVAERICFRYSFQRKYFGQVINLKVLRQKKVINIKILLQDSADSTYIIPAREFVMNASYFIESGLVFQPVTQNLLDTIYAERLGQSVDFQHGHVTQIPKKHSQDQLVVLNSILDSDFSLGYQLSAPILVKSINGHNINNMQDVKLYLSKNNKPYHKIILQDGQLLIIDKLTKAQQRKILNYHGIVKASV